VDINTVPSEGPHREGTPVAMSVAGRGLSGGRDLAGSEDLRRIMCLEEAQHIGPWMKKQRRRVVGRALEVAGSPPRLLVQAQSCRQM
jgi:hypothetical protein